VRDSVGGWQQRPDSSASAVASTGTRCFLQGPPFDVHIDNSQISLGDVVYNSEQDEYLVVWSEILNNQTVEVWAARVGPDADVRDTFKVAG
jgi:hypothetical protein